MHIAAGPHGGRLLHMAAAAVSMVCPLGSRSRGSLPEAMAARGGRISTPASQALGERLSGRETGPVREGRSEAHVTVWWDLVSLTGNLDGLAPCPAAPTRSARAIANYRSRPSVFTTKYIEFSPRQARRPTRHF